MERIAFEDWASRAPARDALRDFWLRDRAERLAADWGHYQAHCALCGGSRVMSLATGAEGVDPNLREVLLCAGCKLNPRLRAGLGLLQEEMSFSDASRLYVTEQATHTFAWMQKHFRGQVLGSEFERDAKRRQELGEYLRAIGGRGEVHFQDVTALDFADGSIDAIASFEVLEHVPDYERALSEFARVLRQGGVLVASFPFIDAERTIVRARLRDGGIEHLLEPEYHGDPISGGVLCWYHFGWDVLDLCRRSGFRHARMEMPRDPAQGLYYGLWTLVARK